MKEEKGVSRYYKNSPVTVRSMCNNLIITLRLICNGLITGTEAMLRCLVVAGRAIVGKMKISKWRTLIPLRLRLISDTVKRDDSQFRKLHREEVWKDGRVLNEISVTDYTAYDNTE